MGSLTQLDCSILFHCHQLKKFSTDNDSDVLLKNLDIVCIIVLKQRDTFLTAHYCHHQLHTFSTDDDNDVLLKDLDTVCIIVLKQNKEKLFDSTILSSPFQLMMTVTYCKTFVTVSFLITECVTVI